MKTNLIAGIFLIGLIGTSCATAPKIDDNSSTQIDLESAKDFKLKIEASKQSTGISDYKFKDQNFKAEWISCMTNPTKPLVAIFLGEELKITTPFCDSWAAQVIIKSGFNVVAVNRPSVGQSTGQDDFSGPQTVAAITAGLKDGRGKNSIIGFWGFGTGSIAASFAAKATPNLKWLLLGNGFYDMEIVERTTKSDGIKKQIKAQRIAEGDSVLESRSIAWDASGLPKLIGIYHASLDDVAPKAQADAFNDQLRTSQTKVFYDDVQGVGHDIPWQAHYQIVSKAIKNLNQHN